MQSDPIALKAVLDVIRKGGVAAFPTDTVYGIGCAVDNAKAIQQLYAIKERDALKAIPVLIGSLDQMEAIASDFNKPAQILAENFWPGALTIVIQKNQDLPQELSSFATVGIRMPAHDWLLELMKNCGPLAATSANISGGPSPSTAQEVFEQLDGRIELIIDGGECRGGIPSTVVDCSQAEPKILREGGISSDKIINKLARD